MTIGWRKIVTMADLDDPFSTSYVLVHMDVVLVCNFMHSMRAFLLGSEKNMALR